MFALQLYKMNGYFQSSFFFLIQQLNIEHGTQDKNSTWMQTNFSTDDDDRQANQLLLIYNV